MQFLLIYPGVQIGNSGQVSAAIAATQSQRGCLLLILRSSPVPCNSSSYALWLHVGRFCQFGTGTAETQGQRGCLLLVLRSSACHPKITCIRLEIFCKVGMSFHNASSMSHAMTGISGLCQHELSCAFTGAVAFEAAQFQAVIAITEQMLHAGLRAMRHESCGEHGIFSAQLMKVRRQSLRG